MDDKPRVEQRAAVPYVAIPCHVSEDGVAAAVDSAFPELFRWLGDRGIEPLGPPFIRSLEIDPSGRARGKARGRGHRACPVTRGLPEIALRQPPFQRPRL